MHPSIEPLNKSITVWMGYNKDREELSHCPVCYGREFEVKDNIRRPIRDSHLVQCKHCGFVTYNPQPKDLQSFYVNSPRPQSVEFLQTKNKKRIMHERLLFHYLNTNLEDNPPQSMLDYGCSDGYLLEMFQEYCEEECVSSRVKGIELNPGHANWAKYYKGLDVTTNPNLDEIDGTFDMVVLYHVLEHIQQPDKLMEKLAAKVNMGGLLYVALPTLNRLIHSIDYARTPQEIGKSETFKDEHINLFTETLLEDFISTFGFTRVFYDGAIYGSCWVFKKTSELSGRLMNIDFEVRAEVNKKLLESVHQCYEMKRQMESLLVTDRKEAIKYGKMALNAHDNFPELIGRLANMLDPVDYEDFMVEWIAKKPDMPELKIDLAVKYFSDGRFDEAEKLFLQLYDELIYDDTVVAHLAYINYHKGEVLKAIEWFKVMLNYDPYERSRIATFAGILTNL